MTGKWFVDLASGLSATGCLAALSGDACALVGLVAGLSPEDTITNSKLHTCVDVCVSEQTSTNTLHKKSSHIFSHYLHACYSSIT